MFFKILIHLAIRVEACTVSGVESKLCTVSGVREGLHRRKGRLGKAGKVGRCCGPGVLEFTGILEHLYPGSLWCHHFLGISKH